ncbi:MAG: N-6 DNA methylase [Chloroflexi bacterium]|nr:N-6 DNA methylase [Chloroflexota bacterium]
MASTKEYTQQRIAGLVASFRALTSAQLRGYHEANTKSAFIEPLFAALGWNVFSADEVAREEKASGGRVDYAFKVGGVSRFYVEAKPLRDELNDPEWVKQALTYAYNKGVSWAVLTNFRSFQVFNAHWEVRDLARARALNLACDDYVSDFEKLWMFSKEGVEAEALDREAAKWGMPPRLPVEKRLYGQLREWRAALHTNLYRYEHDNHLRLSFEQIDETILRLFNRLVFIRNAEDRRLEERALLAALHAYQSGGRKGRLLEAVRQVFRTYDGYYDSDLFTLHLCDQAFLEDTLLEGVISGLYDLPGGLASYDFSVLDADVLGAVYEQYLGHVAIEAKEKAQQQERQLALGIVPAEPEFDITAKKQKRKERGVYYTPTWVVDYIVEQTVGRYIKEHSHNEILNMKVLDPACGSGSFLIRAYQVLLDYHAQVAGRTAPELDMFQRLAILTRNIHGVDLDPQAVEIARLNLLLRAVAKREVLPSLKENVRVGNSLISGTEAELRPYFGNSWEQKRPFNWEREFPDIMARGGFDVVIGNPPYVRIQSLGRDDADYYYDKYDSAFGSFDIYVPFIEQGLKLLRPGGWLGYITSGKFLKAAYGKRLQALLSRQATVETIVDLSAQRVFAEATTYPTIMIARQGSGPSPLRYVGVGADDCPEIALGLSALPAVEVPQAAIRGGVWPPPSGDSKILMDRMATVSDTLGMLSGHIFQGIITSADRVYLLEKRREAGAGLVVAASREMGREVELEAALLKPLLSGKHVQRYAALETRQLLLFPYEVTNGAARLISPQTLQAHYPHCWAYLVANRERLEGREGGKMRHDRWYAFVYPKNLTRHDYPKLVIPRLVRRLEAYYDAQGKYYLDNVDVGGLLLKETSDNSYRYVLGLLNSSLLDWYFRQVSVPFRGGYRSANRQFIEPLPIHRINFGNRADKQMHDSLVALVERMLELNRRLSAKGDVYDSQRENAEREVERTDREIDDLVYDLYGLTSQERALVEASAGTRRQ